MIARVSGGSGVVGSWQGRAESSSARPDGGLLDGWQLAGVFLLFSLLSPALVSGNSQDWAEGLGLTLLSSPLLAWLLIPLRPSDDLFDEANRRRAESSTLLATVLIWTWPWTCFAPLAAIVRCIRMLRP